MIEALGALERWREQGNPRRVSEDVVALSLGALASEALGYAPDDFLEGAVAGVADMASRTTVVPDFHFALVAWALDEAVPDRSGSPWVELRAADVEPDQAGMTLALSKYVQHIAAPTFRAEEMVQELVRSEIDVHRLPPEYAAVWLWLLTAVISKAAPMVSRDGALMTLMDQRSDLAARLAFELGEENFVAVGVSSPESEHEGDAPKTHMSPVEALLIDIALASPNREPPWLTFDEADALFGEATASERAGRLRWKARTAFVSSLAGVAAGAALFLFALHVLDIEKMVSAWLAAVVVTGTTFEAARLWRSASTRRNLANSVVTLFATAWLCSCLLLANALMEKPLVDAVPGTVLGVLLSAVAGLLAARTGNEGSS